MSTTVLLKKATANALKVYTTIRKFDALRYLPNLAFGFLQFNSAGELTATTDPVIEGNLKFAPAATASNITTAGAGTYTAAHLANGLITRDCNGAGRTDTTDTAENIITSLALTANYQERHVVVVNTSDQAETITLAGGTGVTLKGSITVVQNTATKLAIMRTAADKVTIREI